MKTIINNMPSSSILNKAMMISTRQCEGGEPGEKKWDHMQDLPFILLVNLAEMIMETLGSGLSPIRDDC